MFVKCHKTNDSFTNLVLFDNVFYLLKVTTNVIEIVDNTLRIFHKEHLESDDVTTSTRILDTLEAQVSLYQTKGDSRNNLTVSGDHLEVKAVHIPESSLDGGIGFGSWSPGTLKGIGQIVTDTTEIHKSDFDTSIVLPPGLVSLFASNETCT